MTDFSADELREIILRALRQAARDVDERRVPLDGRVRLPPNDEADQPEPVNARPSHAAE